MKSLLIVTILLLYNMLSFGQNNSSYAVIDARHPFELFNEIAFLHETSAGKMFQPSNFVSTCRHSLSGNSQFPISLSGKMHLASQSRYFEYTRILAINSYKVSALRRKASRWSMSTFKYFQMLIKRKCTLFDEVIRAKMDINLS